MTRWSQNTTLTDVTDLTRALGHFPTGQNPDVGGNASVVEELPRQGVASSQSFSSTQRLISLSPLPASPVNSGDPGATLRDRLHVGQHVQQEKRLAVRDARHTFPVVTRAALGLCENRCVWLPREGAAPGDGLPRVAEDNSKWE